MSIDNQELAFPQDFGFCGGVAAADQLAATVAGEAQAYDGIAVFGLHEIVHNRDVARKHEAAGVTFVSSVDEIPENSAVIVSAHGVGPEIIKDITDKGGEIFDATCPLVTHTHKGAEMARQNNEKVIYVCHGKPGEVDKLHDEVAGMLGHLDFRLDFDGTVTDDPVERSFLELDEQPTDELLSDGQKYRIITQTTLHADDCLRYREDISSFIKRFQPGASVVWSHRGDVCRAVADRQKGVEQLVELKPGRIVVATDPTSKNGKGYVKLAQELVDERGLDTTVHAVANADEARQLSDIEGLTAMTASASTPTETIREIAAVLGEHNPPEPADKVFKLHDMRTGVIAAKMAALATRQ